MGIAAAIEHALLMAFTMAWEILWALILGFSLSAVIQAVVSKEEMVRLLLGLKEAPCPPDASDALAVAICHINTSATHRRMGMKR